MQGLDDVQDWTVVLSVGEVQRLAFARLLYHNPAFAVLDEATSAIEASLRDKILQACLNRNITLISTAHDDAICPFHAQVLRLGANGSFPIETVDNPRTKVIKGKKKNRMLS